MNIKKYKYNIDTYNFVGKVEKLYNVNDLSEIHSDWSGAIKYDILDDIEADQKTVYHKYFYNNIKDTNWYSVYDSFIKEFIQPIIGKEILYQKIPTFRVHQPDNLAVATFHRDGDYSHSKDEINFYLPLTKAWGNNTVWTETVVDKKDFIPIEGDVGDVWLWRGANLLHGNELNDTGKSRVSIDFRVLPKSLYVDNNMISISNKTKMIIG